MINRVVKTSWALDERTKKNGFCYKVYYEGKGWKSGRVVTYTHHQSLPLTVVEFIMNAGSCETVYIPEKDHTPQLRGVKRETYRA